MIRAADQLAPGLISPYNPSVPMGKEYDPRMHSAEHILNQTMVRLFHRGRSFSTHIEKRKSKCDYHFDRPLSAEEVADIEGRVNDVIRSGVEVTEDFLPRDDAARMFSLDRLPDEAGNTIRIIRIGDYDACPCIGTHVRTTSEIGLFRIVSTTYENGVLRVRFRIADG